MTFDIHTLVFVGQPIQSNFIIKPYVDWKIEDDISELTKKLTQIFVSLLDQPFSKFQLRFA